MAITMDAAGRIVIPKSIRETQGWTAGIELEIRNGPGRVELEARHVPMHLEPRGGVWVAVKPGVPTMSAATAEAAIETVRRGRGRAERAPGKPR